MIDVRTQAAHLEEMTSNDGLRLRIKQELNSSLNNTASEVTRVTTNTSLPGRTEPPIRTEVTIPVVSVAS